MRADLHIHSWYSDGEASPAELARMAREIGLELFSLTDHDTLDGTEEAREAAEREGVGFLSGVELSTHGALEIHILGYRTEQNVGLASLCADIAVRRANRAEEMVRRLNRTHGFGLGMDEVRRAAGKSTAICRVHIAKALVARGLTESVRSAFRDYVGTDCPCFVRTHELTGGEAVEALKAGGSVPVLAHPVQIHADDARLRQLLFELRERGLAGIEADYATHTSSEAAYYARLADEFGLFCTVGSDFHGSYRRNRMGTPETGLGADALEILGVLKK